MVSKTVHRIIHKRPGMRKRNRLFQWVLLLAIVYGTGMEFVQKYLVVNRSFDGADIVADAAGATRCLSGY